MKAFKKGQIYLVSWIDTFSTHGWIEVEEMSNHCKNNKEYIKTIGFYIGEMSGYHVFSPQFTDNPEMKNWSGMTAIPKGVIKKASILK